MTGKSVATLPNHQARAHSKVVGGSTAKRVINCTSSVLHNMSFPNTESDFAAEGTACHEAVDFILMGKTEQDTDVIGLVFNKVEITEKLYDEAIQPAIEYFDAIDEELGGIDFFNEQRVKVPIKTPILDEHNNIIGWDPDAAFGTCDIIGYAPKVNRTIVLDWKFGVGVAVTADENEQMLYYALGAMHTRPTDQFFAKDREVELFIAQPRSKDGEPFTRWVTSVKQIEAFGHDLQHAVNVAFSDEAEFKMGPWCKFCPGESTCPARQNLARSALELTPEQIAANLTEWLPQADRLIELGKAIKDAAHKAAELGATFPTHKLVKKRADREWIDEGATHKALVKAGLKPADLLTEPKFISPAQAEIKLKKIGVKELPLDPKKQPLFKKESTGTSLVPIDDNRPAVQVTAKGLSKLAERLAGR